MCLVAIAVMPRPDLPLVVIANRDESLARPTAPMHAWPSGVIAGTDLLAGGTWMGIHPARGRVAMITNVRDPRDLRPHEPGERSRGTLVSAYLEGEMSAADYAAAAHHERSMRGFNLVAIDGAGAYWASNRGGGATALGPGIFGVSNALLDTPWPKVVRAKERLASVLSRGEGPPELEALFAILGDAEHARDAELPDTGVGLDLERALSPIRIAMPGYGTRCSTVLIVHRGAAHLVERTVAPGPIAQVAFEVPFEARNADRTAGPTY